MTSLHESLTAYAHQAWSGWMDYLFAKSMELDGDGSVTIPASLVDRWERQAATDYADLPEDEQESDLKEADKMLALMRASSNGTLVLEGVLDWNWDEIRIGDKDFTTEMQSRFPDDNGNSGKRYRFIIERLDEPEAHR